MIERKSRHQEYYMKKTILKEIGPNPSAEDVLDFLLNSKSYCIRKYSRPSQKTVVQRLNHLWFIPLIFLSLPFQWIIKGSAGIKRESKLGSLVEKLIGFD